MPAMNTERLHMNTWLVIAITVVNILFLMHMCLYVYLCFLSSLIVLSCN